METTAALRKMAERGDADAQFRLGYRLAYGRNRPRPTDWPAVFGYWQSAAEAGHARAQFYLGVCYDNGYGVAADLTTAMRWWEKAAVNGHEVAAYNLAFSYRTGNGVPQNDGMMLHWLEKAVKMGDPDAQRDLGVCYHEGKGVPIDDVKAVFWYKKAAAGGDRKAMYNLGLCYKAGDGVAASPRWATGRRGRACGGWRENTSQPGLKAAPTRMGRPFGALDEQTIRPARFRSPEGAAHPSRPALQGRVVSTTHSLPGPSCGRGRSRPASSRSRR